MIYRRIKRKFKKNREIKREKKKKRKKKKKSLTSNVGGLDVINHLSFNADLY